MPGHFLDQVHLTRDIDAVSRHRHLPPTIAILPFRVAQRHQREAEMRQRPRDERRVDGLPKEAADPAVPERDAARHARRRVPVDHRPARTPRTDPLQQGADPLEGDHWLGDVGAALEAIRGFRAEPKLLARSPHGDRLEERALERDDPGALADFRVGPAHDPSDGLGPFGIGDDEHLARQPAIHAVERPKLLASAGSADPDLSAREPVEIEGVRRVSELHQHVIARINDVVDRPDPDRLQACRHPGRRLGHVHVRQGRRVAGAERGLLERDRQRVIPSIPSIPSWPSLARRSAGYQAGVRTIRAGQTGRVERGVVDRRHLAGDTRYAEAIGPVRGDLEVQHRLVFA